MKCTRITCRSAQPLFQSVNSLETTVMGRALNRHNAFVAHQSMVAAFGYALGG